MELQGVLHKKNDTVTVSEKFKKREFVLQTEVGSPYPQFINIQLSQDKTELLDKFNIGDELTVSINIKGREYNNPTKGLQYFNSIEAWRIVKVENKPNFS